MSSRQGGRDLCGQRSAYGGGGKRSLSASRKSELEQVGIPQKASGGGQ